MDTSGEKDFARLLEVSGFWKGIWSLAFPLIRAVRLLECPLIGDYAV